jgi:hypothetical protein
MNQQVMSLEITKNVQGATRSPDSAHFVYTAMKGGKWFVVVDDQPGPAYDKLPFKPSVTSDAVEYLAERDGWVLRCRRPF